MKRVGQSILLAATLVLACLPAIAADVSHGASVYATNCSGCHGDPRTEASLAAIAGADNVALIQNEIISEPRMDTLTFLTVTDLTDVAAYLQTFVIVPQTGYWWNPAEGGRGFTIEQNPASGNVFFATFLYAASGSSTWFAGGPAHELYTTLSVPLAAFSGGQTLTGAFKAATQGRSPGNVTVLFTDPTHGTLSWPGGIIEIERYEFTPGGLASPPTATQPQSGYWWNPAEGGRGYTIEVQNNVIFIAAYMYDATGSPVWYASGPTALTSNSTYQGTWFSYAGGQTLTGQYQSATSITPAGSLTIQFSSPTAAVLTLPDGRQIPIQRYSF